MIKTNCQCQNCGVRFWLKPSKIRKGYGKFCAWPCYAAQMKNHHHATRHGDNKSKEHAAWSDMLGRCRNPNNPAYHHYGGRGIGVCSRWLLYENFLTDMGRKPTPRHSLDRINNDGDYEPSNCRWATQREQCRNMRRTIQFSIQGVSKSLKEWCEIYNVSYDRTLQRIKKGLTPIDALTRPVQQGRPLSYEKAREAA